MGAWDTGIFGDDVACDIRAEFRRALSEGRSAAQARRQIFRDWKPALEDEEDGPVIWLALAALQARYGCLEKQVKCRALAIIDGGSDVERWRGTGDNKLIRSRQAVLERLRARLVAPARRASRLPPRRKRRRTTFVEKKSNWPLGELVSYRLLSGKHILLHVCDYFGSTKMGFAPILALLDRRGKRIPSREAMQRLPLLTLDDTVSGPLVFQFAVGRVYERELPQARIMHLGVFRQRHLEKILGHFYVFRWKYLDRHLEDYLGWK